MGTRISRRHFLKNSAFALGALAVGDVGGI